MQEYFEDEESKLHGYTAGTCKLKFPSALKLLINISTNVLTYLPTYLPTDLPKYKHTYIHTSKRNNKI